MKAPQRGPRRYRALVGLLLAGVLLLALPARSAEANGEAPLATNLVGTIHNVVDLLAQSMQQGNKKQTKQVDQALHHLLVALKHDQAQFHQNFKGHGGPVHKGMGQFVNFDNQQGDFGKPSKSKGGNKEGGKGGKGGGSFGKGMEGIGGKQSGKGGGSFGKGMNQAGQCQKPVNLPGAKELTQAANAKGQGPAGKTPGAKPTPTATGPAGSPKGGLKNGFTSITNNISNDFKINNNFNAPTNFNVNTGKQTLVQNVKTPTTGGKPGPAGNNVGTKKPPSPNLPPAIPTAPPKTQPNKMSVNPTAVQTKAPAKNTSPTSGKVMACYTAFPELAGANARIPTSQVGSKVGGGQNSAPAVAPGKGANTKTVNAPVPTSNNAKSTTASIGSVKTNVVSTAGTAKPPTAKSAPTSVKPQPMATTVKTPVVKGTAHQQVSQVGKMPGTSAAKAPTTNMAAAAPRNIGASVGKKK